jgi:hypothetical protein
LRHAQREKLLRWRDAGHLPDSSLGLLEHELDHEERALPARRPLIQPAHRWHGHRPTK